jgi:hypothetical protein
VHGGALAYLAAWNVHHVKLFDRVEPKTGIVPSAASRYDNARLIHLPVHASWLNQAELLFSIVQRKALTPTTSARCTNSPGA